MGSVSHRICRARVPYRVICHAEYGEQSAVSAKAHESPEFTPEFLRFAMWSRDAHVEDATEATLGGDGGATRDKDAACRQASFAALSRSNKGGECFSVCEWSVYDMTSASYSMAGEPRRWSRHGFEMQAARAAGTMPYAGLGRVQSKLFPVRRRGTHWTAIVGLSCNLV